MAKAVFKRVVVTSPYYKVSGERKQHTKATRNQFGMMTGRRLVPVAQSDRTGYIVMKKPFDVNKDGDTKDKVDLQRGQIIGRTSSPGNKPARVTIMRHMSGNSVVRTHNRNLR